MSLSRLSKTALKSKLLELMMEAFLSGVVSLADGNVKSFVRRETSCVHKRYLIPLARNFTGNKRTSVDATKGSYRQTTQYDLTAQNEIESSVTLTIFLGRSEITSNKTGQCGHNKVMRTRPVNTSTPGLRQRTTPMRTGSILGQAELTERLFDEAGLGELTFLHRDVIVLEV